MHDSAYQKARAFVVKYLGERTEEKLEVIDFGSQDVNGSLNPLFANPNWSYRGIDMVEGKNVDIKLDDPYKLPLKNSSIDVIVTSSCFEHNPMFWKTFDEFVRVLKKGGLMYICVPSKGHHHYYPYDCWRFYKDSWKALEISNPKAELIESYLDEASYWGDNVGIYRKK